MHIVHVIFSLRIAASSHIFLFFDIGLGSRNLFCFVMIAIYLSFLGLVPASLSYYPIAVIVLAVANIVALGVWNLIKQQPQNRLFVLFVWLFWYVHSNYYPVLFPESVWFIHYLISICYSLVGLYVSYSIYFNETIPNWIVYVSIATHFLIPPLRYSVYSLSIWHTFLYVVVSVGWLYYLNESKKHTTLPPPVMIVGASVWILFDNAQGYNVLYLIAVGFVCSTVMKKDTQTLPSKADPVMQPQPVNIPPTIHIPRINKAKPPRFTMKSQDPLIKGLKEMQSAPSFNYKKPAHTVAVVEIDDD